MPIPMMFDWGETKASLWFSFKAPGATQQNTDILISRYYMKVNKAPHFFECDFFDQIDFKNPKTTIKFENGNIFIAMMKDQSAKYTWNAFKLMPGQKYGPATDLKEALTIGELRDRRISSENEYKAHIAAVKEEAARLKAELSRTALDQQWKAEQNVKDDLAERKLQEREQAVNAVRELITEEQAVPEATPKVPAPVVDKRYVNEEPKEEADSDDDEAYTEEMKAEKKRAREKELEDRKAAEAKREADRQAAQKAEAERLKQEEEKERRELAAKIARGAPIELAPMNAARQKRIEKKGELPPVRQVDDMGGAVVEKVIKEVGGMVLTADPSSLLDDFRPEDAAKSTTIKISMTKKVFPNVPVREQHLLQQPLPRQGGAKAVGGAAGEDNPVWLKDKADQFYKVGDFASAVAAYEAALEKAVDDEWSSRVLSNQSECLVHMGKLDEAKAALDNAVYKLAMAAFQRAEKAESTGKTDAAPLALPSKGEGLMPRPAVMDASMHRLWASLRARQTHVHLLQGAHKKAEACLVDALEVPDALGEQLVANLRNSLKKLRDGMKEEEEKAAAAAAQAE